MSSADILTLVPRHRAESAVVGEADHRVANHLALLANLIQAQAGQVAQGPQIYSRTEVQAILREVAGKVVGIGQLHRRLISLPPGQAIDLVDYLIESSQALIKALSLEGRIGIVHRLTERCAATADLVQTIALILGEIMMNAIKHAHPTGLPVEIAILCHCNAQGRIAVEIGDDGVGLPETFDTRTGGGIGFRLIRQLAGSICADLDIASDSLGTRFLLTLPQQA